MLSTWKLTFFFLSHHPRDPQMTTAATKRQMRRVVLVGHVSQVLPTR